MDAVQTFVVPQQLESIHQELGAAMCKALALLTSKLTDMPLAARAASPREYAELREAKALISNLKYPDSTAPVRIDELAWALKRIKDNVGSSVDHEWGKLFATSERLLGIDLSDAHPMPEGLAHRIANELRLHEKMAATFALAV